MAGAGIQLFLSGQIATAADVNQYLMDQSVCLFLNVAERDGAFGNGIPISQAGGDGKPALSAGRLCFLLEAPGSTQNNPIRTVQFYNGTTWVDSGQFTIDDGTVTSAKLNAGVAGNGLAGGAGTALSVNVDDSTIEINADALRVKNAGITSVKLGSDLSLTGTTKIEEIFEKAIINTIDHPSDGSPLTLDIADGAVYYYTQPCPHTFTLDITATGMVTGQALTLVFMMTSSATTGRVSLIKVNNTTPASIKWFGGNQYPLGSGGNAVDAYTITIFRYTASGVDYFHVFASQSKFA